MRIYGSIHICFWANSDIQKLSDQEKLLALYLSTGPHSNMLGCVRLPDGYITEDLNWSMQDVKKAFHKLSHINFLTRDEKSCWLVVHDFLKWNPIQNPRQGIGIRKLFDLVPSQSIVIKPLIKGLITHGKYLPEGFLNELQNVENGLDTPAKNNVADNDQDQKQDQDKDKLIMSGKPDVDTQNNLNTQAIEVLAFLNEKTGRAYRPVDANLKLIVARLKSGATVVDCRQVIAKKTREWKSDVKMAEYLRPATLFNAIKFEQYMGELTLPQNEEVNNGY